MKGKRKGHICQLIHHCRTINSIQGSLDTTVRDPDTFSDRPIIISDTDDKHLDRYIIRTVSIINMQVLITITPW